MKRRVNSKSLWEGNKHRSEVVLSQEDSGGPSCRSWINRLQSHRWDPVGESFGRQNLFFLETQHKIIVQSVCLISDFYSALCNINPRACFLGEVIVVASVAEEMLAWLSQKLVS